MGKFDATKPKRVIKKAVGVTRDSTFESKAVRNYMASNSFTLDPLAALKFITASSIFAEPAYYESKNDRARKMEDAIDAALDYDFLATLEYAASLRKDYYMRLNPQVILVRASVHPKRVEFTAKYPSFFSKLTSDIALRPDDITNGLAYYISFIGKGKSKVPGILKRSYAKRLEQFKPHILAKYATRGKADKGINLIDVTRIVHANNAAINDLMKGTIKLSEDEVTWRTMRSAGKTWNNIINSGIKLSHSDLLFQMRNIANDVDADVFQRIIELRFLSGVEDGMLFPYNYWTAYKTLQNEQLNNKEIALKALERAIDISIFAQPKVGENVDVLVDNSGSARGAMAVEGASSYVYEIGNLSGVMTAMNASSGRVGVFGDRLEMISLDRGTSALKHVENINRVGSRVGQSTENGIWLYWRDMINTKRFVDSVFIYSDMQAGTGGLYGINPYDYAEYRYNSTRNIDVWKLVEKYRETVNRKVNVFSVQIAGYDNSIMPENKYRGANLAGWTGKEARYAREIIDLWDGLEK